MNKKSLISMLVSLCLVGAIGLGATFAYLSTTTGELKNTFTVGEVSGTLFEKVPDGGVITAGSPATGYNYKDLLPGQTIVKAPYITATANTSTKIYADAVAYIKVKGLDALNLLGFNVNDLGFNQNNLTKGWTKIAELDGTAVTSPTGLDGIYVFDANTLVAGIDPLSAGESTTDLFSGITFGSTVEGSTLASVNNVQMVGCLVQADYSSDTDTNTIATTKLGSLLP